MEPRKGFVFYHSWWMAIVNLPREIQGDVLAAIIEYGLTGAVTEPLKPVAHAMLEMVKPQIEANNKRYLNGVKGAGGGVKGGRPKKVNPEETPEKPQINPKKTPKEPQENPEETPKEKDKDIREDKSSSSSSPPPVEDSRGLRNEIEAYKQKPIWKANIAKKFKIDAGLVDGYLDEFYIDMSCREVNVLKVSSLFISWLSEKLTSRHETYTNYTRSGRSGLRSKLPPAPGHGLRED